MGFQLGLFAKLTLAVFTIGSSAAIAFSGYQLFSINYGALSTASDKVNNAYERTWNEFKSILEKNRELSARLAADPAFQKAWTDRDKPAVISAVKEFASANHISELIAIYDRERKVFYSTETPEKSGYSVAAQIPELPIVLSNPDRASHYSGALAPTQTGTIGIGNMQRLPSGDAVVAICQPMDTPFLTALQQKLVPIPVEVQPPRTPAPAQNAPAKSKSPAPHRKNKDAVDFVAYNIETSSTQGSTPNLKNNDGGYLQQLHREGLKAIRTDVYEYGDRLWKAVPLLRAEGGSRTPAVVIITAAINPRSDAIVFYVTVCAIAAAVLIVTFFVFVMSLRK